MSDSKRFTWLKKDVYAPQIVITDSLTDKDLTPTDCYELLNELYDENEQLKKRNKKLKLQNGELLYQIGKVGKNNKTCRECECFIPEHNICYMWDMEVEADDVVVACDQRKIKNEVKND